MRSYEYPDLEFVKPAAFGIGRAGYHVRYVVIHYTAGAERNTSAEDGAAFDARRQDGTSTHYFVDRDSIVQCVLTWNRANAARHRGNRLGIQYELCGTQQTRAGWLDPASRATLERAARQVAKDCLKYGIPPRRLSVAETRAAWSEYPNGPKGIVGHVDCTRAYPEDGGDHTDPGIQFPWDVFLPMVKTAMEGDDVTNDQLRQACREAFEDALWDGYNAARGTDAYKKATTDRQREMRNVRDLFRGILGGPVDLTQLESKLDAIATRVGAS